MSTRYLEGAIEEIDQTAVGHMIGENGFGSQATGALVLAQAIDRLGDKLAGAISDHTESIEKMTKALYWLGLGDPDKPTATGALECVAQQIGEVAGALRDRK
jgi:hypothetical protein